MGRTFKKGGLLGVVFGAIALLIIGFIFGRGRISLSAVQTQEGITIIIVGLFFSFIYGGWIAKKIVAKNWIPGLSGVLSSLLTTISTVILYVTIGMVLNGTDVSLSLEMMGVFILYSIILGGLPMLILGAIYGILVKRFITLK